MNEQVQAELKKIFNGRFSTSESARANYARGEDTYDPILSQAVVFPETNEEVSKILKLCNQNKIPVVPFGTGTSLEGNVVGNENGITICLEKMNKILDVNVEDFDCRVQACVTREQLNEHLREDGVFFPIDPVTTAQQVIQYGIPIARIEMLNADQMGISINYSKLKDIKAVPTLFFEFHGSEISNNENIKIVEDISKDNNGSSFKWAKDLEERNKIWKARWDVYYSVKALHNNGRVYSTDVCVPISNITECVKFAEEQAKKFGVRAPMVGHMGDGNFHVVLPYDPAKKEMYKQIRAFNDTLIRKALELNGTITGEHGVGLHKKEYLLEQHPDNIPVMKSIKRTLDPNNIMNPGKIFDLN